MQRTKNGKLADAVFSGQSANYTQVPNDLLRNPDISCKAKTILALLLSNREGWKSCVTGLNTMMKEGRQAISSGLAELEGAGYLLRRRYRNKKTKTHEGTLWMYTDTPGYFVAPIILDKMTELNLEFCDDFIKNQGTLQIEPQPAFPHTAEPDTAEPDTAFHTLIIHNNKKTKGNNTNGTSSVEADGRITSGQFDQFWEIYPRKVDKGKAKKSWEQLCTSKSKQKDRPTWSTIHQAILSQSTTERWANPEFIPHPSTWLNQFRWLDDPDQMKVPTRRDLTTPRKPSSGYRSGRPLEYRKDGVI